jgi:subtilisin-like proprotein convertase family protein
MKQALALGSALIALLLSLTCAAQSYPGSNLGPIPDGLAGGAARFGPPRDVYFDVGQLRTVADVSVSFTGSHSYVGDMRVTLIGPNGNSHVLFARTGATTTSGFGFGSDLSGTYTFTDNPAVGNWWIAAANDPIPAGAYRTTVSGGAGVSNPAPVTSLSSAFLNTLATGRWILRFEDGTELDTGTITAANLALTLSGSTRNVSNANDSGNGSLRNAIAAAGSGDMINFATPFFSSPRTINLLTPLPFIAVPIAIRGPGADLLTVRRDDSAGDMGIFRIIAGGTSRVSLSGMTVNNGRLVGSIGGGIYSGSPLTLFGMNVSGNQSSSGGGVYLFGASGEFINSTFSGNVCTGAGGGIYHDVGGSAPLRIVNSTVNGNTCLSGGAGINVIALNIDSRIELINSTVSDNRSDAQQGAGIRVFSNNSGTAEVKIRNSIVANNTPSNFGAESGGSGPAIITSLGFNLSSNYNGVVSTLASDLTGDPKLGPLALQGGSVPTRLLLAGSPALEAGNSSGQATDQRGYSRPYDNVGMPNVNGGNGADIGAVEMQSIVVFSANDSGAGSLRNAIAYANQNGPGIDILFDPTVFATPQTINLASALPLLGTMTMTAPGASLLTVKRSSGSLFRIFEVDTAANVALTGLTISNGDLGSGDVGGGISNAGTLALTNAVVRDNHANGAGGIRNLGTLFMQGSALVGNSANFDGGGLYNIDGFARVSNSTISGNQAGLYGAGIANGNFEEGGAVALEIVSSTIANNTAQGGGGGIDTFVIGAGGTASLALRNTLLADNLPANLGVDGPATLSSNGFNLSTNNNSIYLNQPTDQNSANAGLAPLANNGGPTLTHALLAGSDALDGGDNAGSGVFTDQRGSAYVRPVNLPLANIGDGSDIGAYEAQFDPADVIFANGFD